MKNSVIVCLISLLLWGCSLTKTTVKPGYEPIKTSQLFDILMDFQLYMWDVDSTTWHQPEKVLIRNSTQPLFYSLFVVQGIKRKNDSNYSDSLNVAFQPKPIQIIEDTDQEFTEFILEENYTSKKLLIETTGRITIDGVEFQMYAVRDSHLNSSIIYVKYYNGIWKDYAPFGSIVRILQ